MSARSRVFLLLLAAALALAVFGLGVTFTYGVESGEPAGGSKFAWLLMAALFASPLWLPAAIPPRLRTLSVVIRWLSAGALLVPLGFMASVVLQQLRVYPGAFFSLPTLATSTLLTVGCMATIVVLLAPEVRRVRGQAA